MAKLLKHKVRYTFIANMIKLRKMKGLTQQDLANELDVNLKSVGSWEECRAFPSIEKVCELSVFFKRDLLTMLTEIYE